VKLQLTENGVQVNLEIKQNPAKSTMPVGNSKRDRRGYAHIHFELIKYYRGFFTKQTGYKEITDIEGKLIKLMQLS